jgi:quinol monooxygenase YgiN
VPSDNRGTVLITVEYRVAPEHAEEFVDAMQERRRQLMRTGAYSWGLYNDAEDPTRFLETFLSESWSEHERQHHRLTVADREEEDLIFRFQVGTDKPVVRHLISARP